MLMNKKSILPDTNPMRSIAELVQREFKAKSTADFLAKTNLTTSGKPRRNSIGNERPMSMPDIPAISGMESQRIIRAAKEKVLNESDNPADWKETEEEKEVFDPLDPDGSIYDDFDDGTPGERPLTNEESALQLALAIRKGHEKGKPDVDWHLVKLLYVYGGWTYERIANECNVSFALVRLNGRRGRWIDAREAYRAEQAQRVSERIALEEDRLRDWQMMKRRQAGVDGLMWFTKAIANLRDEASPESLAKLGGLIDRMLSSVTGLTPVEQGPGAVNVKVENNNQMVGGHSYPPNSPQAKLAAVWDRKTGETETDYTRRLALVIRDLYLDCERAGLYADLALDSEHQRQAKLRSRLGILDVEAQVVSS